MHEYLDLPPFKLTKVVSDLLAFHFSNLKVDGLIRLMEGDNTGPINIGNPGYYMT